MADPSLLKCSTLGVFIGFEGTDKDGGGGGLLLLVGADGLLNDKAEIVDGEHTLAIVGFLCLLWFLALWFCAHSNTLQVKR